MQRGLHAFRRRALRAEHPLGQEAAAIERNLSLQPRVGIVLDELGRACAGKEDEHRVGLQRRDVREVGLELRGGERNGDLFHDGSPSLGEAFAEGSHRLLPEAVVPEHPDDLLATVLEHHARARVGSLPIRERGAEDVGRAERSRHRLGACVGDDGERLLLPDDLHHRHGNAGMNGARQDVHVLADDQLVHIRGCLRGIGFVVDCDPLHLASAELAALLLRGELHGVRDVVAERRVRTRVRQQEPDPKFRRFGGMTPPRGWWTTTVALGTFASAVHSSHEDTPAA